MITAAEGQELLALVKDGPSPFSDDYQRLRELAERVARDAKIAELSARLEVLCGLIEGHPDDTVHVLFDQIRWTANQLAEMKT